jgi:hypothetical protein
VEADWTADVVSDPRRLFAQDDCSLNKLVNARAACMRFSMGSLPIILLGDKNQSVGRIANTMRCWHN